MLIHRFFNVLFLIFLCTASLAASNNSQDEVSQAKTKLTNNNAKLWIFEKVEEHLGTNKCTRGEAWTFYEDGRLEIEKCDRKAQRMERTEKSWIIERKSKLDVVLKLDGVEYNLRFYPKQRGSKIEKMRLQKKPEIITERTRNLIFQHEPV